MRKSYGLIVDVHCALTVKTVEIPRTNNNILFIAKDYEFMQKYEIVVRKCMVVNKT